jgi:F-type H+-transporting ATPase subunit alpha
LKEVPVKSVKDFEEQFLSEMEMKYPEILAEFKKGNLPEDGIKTMVEFAKTIVAQYK